MFRIKVDGINVAQCPNLSGGMLAPFCKKYQKLCKYVKTCEFKRSATENSSTEDKIKMLQQIILPYIPDELAGRVNELLLSIGKDK